MGLAGLGLCCYCGRIQCSNADCTITSAEWENGLAATFATLSFACCTTLVGGTYALSHYDTENACTWQVAGACAGVWPMRVYTIWATVVASATGWKWQVSLSVGDTLPQIDAVWESAEFTDGECFDPFEDGAITLTKVSETVVSPCSGSLPNTITLDVA